MTTLTIAQAEASSATSGLIVADTAANIATGLTAYPNLATKVASFTLSAAGTLSAAQADKLAALGSKFHLGSYGLTVSDSLADLTASANTAGVALATSVAVVDVAYVLLNTPLSHVSHYASVTLTGSPVLAVSAVDYLLEMPNFSISSSASVTLSDRAGNISAAIGSNPAWFHALATIYVQLDATGISPYAATLLAAAITSGKHVAFYATTAHTTLIISGPAQNIGADAASVAILAAHTTLSYSLTSTTVTAASGAALEGLASFSSHLSSLTVSDTAVNVAAHASALFGQGFTAIDVTSGTLITTASNLLATNLQLQGASATLSTSATLTATQVNTLTALHGFTLANGATITVQDTMAHLEALSAGTLLYVTTTKLLAGTSLTLTAAQADTLAAVTGFTNAGSAITVSDTIANLQGNTPWSSIATAHDIVDTAANILSDSSLPLVTGAAAVTLSANATVTAAGAATLNGLSDFSHGIYALIVQDTASNITTDITAVQAVASVVDITGASTVTAAAAETLATLSASTIVASGATLNISDSYANIIASANSSGYALATSLTIDDTAANLATAATNSWGSITPSYVLDASSSVTAAQLTTLGGLGAAFSAGSYTLTLADTAAHVTALTSAIRNVAGAIVVTDVAANITSAVLSAFAAYSVVPSILISDNTNHVAVSAATYAADTSLIDNISYVTPPGSGSTGAVEVTGTALAVDTIQSTLDADSHVGLVAVTDSVADLSSVVLTTLSGFTKPLTITLSDPTDALSVTTNQYSAIPSVIHDIQNATNLQVTGTAAAVAAIATTLASDTKVDGVVVTDSAANINTNVTALTALESKLTIDLNASGAVSVATATLFTNAHAFTPGAFSYTIADTIANVVAASTTLLGNVASVAISDVSTNMTTADLDTLTSDQAALGNGHALTITFTDTGKLTVTYATYASDTSVIDDIANVGAVIVTGTAAQIAGSEAALAADTKVGSVAVTDTAANINTNITNLNTLGAELTSITLTGGGVVSVATAALIEGVTNFTPGTYTYTIADTIADVVGATTAVLGSASGITISDVSTNMTTTYLNTLKTDQTTLGSGHTLAITFSDSGTVSVTAATYTADSAIIDDVTNSGAFIVTDTASAIAAIATTLAADTKVGSVVISDSAANISAVAASLALTGLESKLTIDLSAGGAISAATYNLLHASGVTYNNPSSYTLSLADTAANVLALSDTALDSFSAIAITDTASDLTSTVLGELATYAATMGAVTPTITISGSGITTFSTTTYSTYSTIIDNDITNTGQVAVSGTATQILAIAGTLESDAKVGEIEVADAASTISTDLSSLLAIGSKLSVTLTDTLPITAAEVPQLVQLSINNPTAITVADSGSDIAAVVESASTATTSFLDGATVDLNANAQVTAADAAALETLTHFSLNSHTLVVYDTYSHLISSVYSSTYSWADVSGVYLNTSGGSTLTTANMLALLALPHFAATTPGGSSDSITISDTAAHFASAFATFQTDAAQLTDVSYVVNTSATISDAVLTDLQTLGATAAGSVTVTVRDTAATIAANELTQSGITETITPTAWDLSASAVITLAQAETLGTTSGFSAGSYTLTVNVPTSTVITVAQANALGALGSALVLTGSGQLDVQGTVSQLSALSNAALSIVTPEITDTFVHVASLSNASGLAGGTITISDSEAVSATTASDFFGIIKVGNNAGFAAANVSFGTHTETVTDTIANLQTLTSMGAYTGNATLASAFTLGAADMVANLTTAGNLSYLEGLSSSTLSANSITTATSAENLALIENEIHFSKGSYTLTVSDTPTNLINPTYSDGITLANTLLLSADGSTNAAGAETLFENSKFSLTYILTIADTAANLLDGTLGTLLTSGDYGTDAVVELSTATIVDATTATELAALSGFADPNHYLTISDDPAYLIASSATAAETIATRVTIPTDETVTAATVLKLSEVPNFTPGTHDLDLAGNDVADAATLAAIGSFGTSFNHETYSITMTADDINLTPAEYNSLQSDDIVTNGHLFGAVAATPTVSYAENSSPTAVLTLTTPYAANGTYHLYNSTGSTVSSTNSTTGASTETVTYTDSAHNFSLTESIGSGTASAPVVLLDTATITDAIAATSTGYSAVASGVEVGMGEYLPLYTTATEPSSASSAILVYSPTTHVLSLVNVTTTDSVALITLGGTTFPTALTASEIHVKTFS
jgi:hypothetical protein